MSYPASRSCARDVLSTITLQLQFCPSRAGVVPIVHDSGGPRADIVRPEVTQTGSQVTGFRCTSVEEYAEAITAVLCMDQEERLGIAAAARRYVAAELLCIGCVCVVQQQHHATIKAQNGGYHYVYLHHDAVLLHWALACLIQVQQDSMLLSLVSLASYASAGMHQDFQTNFLKKAS